MTKILLCDLSHTTQGPTSELVPYPIACIKSYYHAHGKHECEIRLLKDPGLLGRVFPEFAPQIVGFSNYMWNRDLSTRFAKKIKELHPETLIIFGGPNFPTDELRQEKWLKKHDMIDIYLEGEGEVPFQETVEKWIETGSIEAVKRAGIFGARSISRGRLLKASRMNRAGFEEIPRLRKIDSMPSPYLMGYLDDFLKDHSLVPLMESNRGCPFTCTYCVDGMAGRSQVNKASTSRLSAELNYIAEHYSGKTVVFADANFGMYAEDVEFCRAIADTRERFDFPHSIITSTGKNEKARVIECSKLLGGALRVAASVQSLDDEVLRNIRRANISYQEMIELSQQLSDTQAHTYSEMILGLPGDSKEKHFSGVGSLIDTGFNQIRMHSLFLSEGSEMETPEQRAKFGLQTRFRVLQRSFGAYPFGGETIRSVEIEEVVTGGREFSMEDYLECRRLNLSVTLFYNERVFFELHNFLKELGVKVSEWLLYVHRALDRLTGPLREVCDRFARETREELHDSAEELERAFLTDDLFFRSFIRGERGNNLLFNTQAHIFVHLMEELHDFAFRRTVDYLASKNMELTPLQAGYLRNLQRYSFEKKRDFTDLRTVREEDFDFDFAALEEEHFQTIPAVPTPSRIRFYYHPRQIVFIEDQLNTYGRTPQALGKLFARTSIKNVQRHTVRLVAA